MMKQKLKHNNVRRGILFSALMMFLVWAGAGCEGQQKTDQNETKSTTTTAPATGEIVQINADKFKTMLDAGEDVAVLDVRTPEEWAGGVVAGAQKINYHDNNFRDELAQLDKNKEYVVYCAVGGRSGKACEVMKEMGFAKVYNVQGGMTDWKAKGYPTE